MGYGVGLMGLVADAALDAGGTREEELQLVHSALRSVVVGIFSPSRYLATVHRQKRNILVI